MLQLDVRQSGKTNQVINITSGCIFIKMGQWTYYLDNSTGEEIVTRYNTDDNFRSVDDYNQVPIWVPVNEENED
jgi:hypothetical protein